MTLSATQLAEVTSELMPLVGGRIQKIDLVDEREAVFEVRVPGRTLRVLVSARSGVGRVHVVETRPERQIPATEVQALLRRRLGGQLLLGLSCEGRTFHIDTPAVRWSVRIDGGRDAFRIIAPVGLALPTESLPIPDRFEISKAIADRYVDLTPKAETSMLRQRLVSALAQRRKKLARLAQNVQRDVDRLEEMKRDGHRGELVKTALHQIKRGDASVEVTDWETSLPVVVVLDPTLDPKSNMARLFTRAKKATRGLPIATARLAKITGQLDDLDAERSRIEAAEPEALDRIARRGGTPLAGIDAKKIEAAAETRPEKQKPIDRWARRFLAADGAVILVGRGAKENDRLTFSGSKADDVWLHARGTSGAHVVLKVNGGRAPSQDALLDAAHLAAFYSSAKNEAKAEVIYTEARHVKKTKGAPPGSVGVARSKTILVRIDRARLDRLLDRENVTKVD